MSEEVVAVENFDPVDNSADNVKNNSSISSCLKTHSKMNKVYKVVRFAKFKEPVYKFVESNKNPEKFKFLGKRVYFPKEKYRSSKDVDTFKQLLKNKRKEELNLNSKTKDLTKTFRKISL